METAPRRRARQTVVVRILYASLTCAVDDAMPLTFRDLLQEHFQYSKKTMASVGRDEPACDLLFGRRDSKLLLT